jgi:nitrite reductase/ring-hydroxylating ferredoxin subunit
MPRSPAPYAAAERLERLEPLDRVAEPLAGIIRRRIPNGRVRDLLSGTWLGHPLHPVMMLWPLGTWTSAVMLDWLGGRGAQHAADRLIALGLAGVPPTAASGASDWSDTWGGRRRVGLVHASSNATSTMLFAASLVARRRGSRRAGKRLALAGFGAAGVGGYLGGHLSYARGIGVDETAFDALPHDWTRALDAADLADDVPRRVDLDGVGVVLVRHDGRVHALAARCCHRGGPLHEGQVEDGCIACPWHGSTFRLEDGSVVRGPAAYPQPALDVRQQDGAVEVRARQPVG